MIILNKIKGEEVLVNCEEIETVESSFDTLITFRSGRKITVSNTYSDIVAKVIEYKRACAQSNLETSDK